MEEKEEIGKLLQDKDYDALRTQQEFFCQLGINKYKEYLNFKIDPTILNSLIKQIPQKRNANFSTQELINKYDKNSIEFAFLTIIAELIAYLDDKAYKKNEFNPDSIVMIGRTGLNQRSWYNGFLKYKKDKNFENITDTNFHNCINFLNDIDNKLPIISSKDITKIFKTFPFLNIDRPVANFKNLANRNKALTHILYCNNDVKLLWTKVDENKKGEEPTMQNPPLNQILYGPPGTGKTYNTVVKAMEIILQSELKFDKDNKTYKDKNNKEYDYQTLKQEFNKAKENHQIEFVTFHQSYSYEEFVEGIKPDMNNADWETPTEKLNYVGKNGIFKKICKKSKEKVLVNKKSEITFNDVINKFKIMHEQGEDFSTLKELNYNNEQIAYKYGNQQKLRKIDLKKVCELYTSNKVYNTCDDFYKDFGGSSGLKYYHYTFYNELLNIKQILTEEKYANDLVTIPHVLIIDEINRGNISKIFGELITLIEPDKRENVTGDDTMEYNTITATLPYSQQPFTVPNNLYIIGTMNTSDRSIASIDIALRRRFKFVEMMPKSDKIDDLEIFGIKVRSLFDTLNKRITILLDRDHQIGHSYFMKLKNNENLENDFQNIWFDEIMPLLNEYFYGDWEKLQGILGEAKEKKKDEKLEAFIQKINIDKNKDILYSNACDENEYYDFVSQDEVDFAEALNYAFGIDTNQNEQKEVTEAES